MIEKLKKIKEKFEELTKELIDPNVLADMSVWQKKAHWMAALHHDRRCFCRFLPGNGSSHHRNYLLHGGASQAVFSPALFGRVALRDRRTDHGAGL